MATLTDPTTLIEAARAGDKAALAALLEAHQNQIYKFALRQCGSEADAQDVLQETMLTVARSIGQFRGDSTLGTWLFTIARSFCVKKHRRGKHAPAEHASIDDPLLAATVIDPGPQPEAAIAGKEIGEALEIAIGELAPMYREVLVLRDGEGLTAPEVAEVLGIGVDAVKSRLHRARAAIRSRLAPYVEGPSPARPSPSCPDVVSLFSKQLEGEIGPEICREMERHLDSCEACRQSCDSLKHTLRLCRTAPNAEVPPNIQEAVRRALRDL